MESSKNANNKEKKYATEKSVVDVALESLGNNGRYQCYIFLLTCFPVFICGTLSISHVFTTAIPKHRCLIDACEKEWNPKSPTELFQNKTFLEFSIPRAENSSSNMMYSSCEKFQSTQTNSSQKCNKDSFDLKTNVECEKYLFDHQWFENTIVTDFQLFCSKEWLVTVLVQMGYFFGIFIGAPLNGILADKFGRLTLYSIYPGLTLFVEVLASFAPNVYVYSICSLVKGYCVSFYFPVSFAIGIEALGGKWRFWLGNTYSCVFAFGGALTSLIGWKFKQWHILEWFNILPTIPMLLFPKIFYESLRWQLSQSDRVEQGLNQLKMAAKINNITLPEKIFDDVRQKFNQTDDKKNTMNSENISLLDLFRNRLIFQWTIAQFYIWFSVSLVYYAMAFLAEKIHQNIYLISFILMLVEIPAILGGAIVAEYTRKKVMIAVFILCGVALIVFPFLPENGIFSVGLAIFGKFAIAIAFAIIFIYTAEIFPTVLRTTGLGMCSMCARIGGVIAPSVLKLGAVSRSLPFIVIGSISLLAAIANCFLPETKGKKLPDHLEDVLNLQFDVSPVSNTTPASTPMTTSNDETKLNSKSGSKSKSKSANKKKPRSIKKSKSRETAV